MGRLRRRTRSSRDGPAQRRGSHTRRLLTASSVLGLFGFAVLVRADAPTRAAEPRASTAARSATKGPAPVSEAAEQRAVDACETLPLSFSANAGQTDERVRYLAQGASYSFFFTDCAVVLSFAQGGQRLALKLRFLGASPDARLEAGHRAAGTVNNTAGAHHTSHDGGSDAFVTAVRTTGHGNTNLGAP